MKRRFTKLASTALPLQIVLVICLFLAPFWGKANHTTGSDASYTCTTTPGVYNVFFKVYRDCGSVEFCQNCPVSLSASCAISISINGISTPTGSGMPSSPCAGVNFGTQNLAVITSVSGFDVVQLCNAKTICSNCGTRTPGTFTPGFEVYVFSGQVNLNSLPSTCCFVSLNWNTCCRPYGINTLVNSGTVPYYTELIINRCASPCNASPVFVNDPKMIACSGQDFYYNVGAIDPDGDSLSYAFGSAMSSMNISAPYVSPFTPLLPFSFTGFPSTTGIYPNGLYLDAITGDLRFRPAGNFIAPLIIEVKQWKNIGGVPTLMGISTRELLLHSQTCASNNPPNLKVYTKNGTPISNTFAFTQSVCAGTELCFIVAAPDTNNLSDTTYLNWNSYSNIFNKGASFTKLYSLPNKPKFDSMLFCWTPHDSCAATLPYYFTVGAKDNICPLPGNISKTFQIYVNKKPRATLLKTAKPCAFYDFSFNLLNTVNLDTLKTQYWIEKTPGSNTYFIYNQQSVQNHGFSAGGWHKIALTLSNFGPPYPNGCPNTIWDSVYISNPVRVGIVNAAHCVGTPVSLQAHGTGGIPFGNSYRYTFYSGNFGSKTIIRSYGPDSNITLNPGLVSDSTRYFVRIQDLNGCQDSAAFYVYTRIPPARMLPATAQFCFNALDTIDAGNNFQSIQSWNWRKIPYMPLADSNQQKILPPSIGTYSVKKTDIYLCVATDTLEVTMQTPVQISAGIDKSTCMNNPPFTLQANGTQIDSLEWRQVPVINPNMVLSRASFLLAPTQSTATYEVRAYRNLNGLTCKGSDTVTLTVLNLPLPGAQLSHSGSDTFCEGSNVLLQANIGSNLNYTWYKDALPISSQSGYQHTTSEAGNYKVLVTDSNLCSKYSNTLSLVKGNKPVGGSISGTLIETYSGIVYTYSVPFQSNYSYSWLLQNGSIQGKTDSNVVKIIWNTAGLTSLKSIVRNPMNCRDTATLNINVFTPSPEILSFNPTAAAMLDTVQIVGQNLNGATTVSFGNTPAQWFAVQNSTSIKAVVGNGSSGSVAVNTPGGMVSKSGFIFLSTGLNQLNGTDKISIYPNPAQDQFTLDFGQEDIRNYSKVRILTLSGQEVLSMPVNQKLLRVESRKLGATGVYLVEVQDINAIIVYRYKVQILE